MTTGFMTYSQLRAALLDRYQRPQTHVSEDRLAEHLDEKVFRPFQSFLTIVDSQKVIIDKLTTDDSLSDEERAVLTAEFQGALEVIIGLYQETLLAVPNEIVD